MAQSVAHSMPHVFQLRRKKVPTELSLPNEYVPTDYTTLSDVDEGPGKPKGPSKVLLILVVLALLAAIGAGVFFLPNDGDNVPTPTPAPAATIEDLKASLIVSGGELNTRITARTNAATGTDVNAILLENGKEFVFWDPIATTTQVENGNIQFNIPALAPRENANRNAEYVVQLSLDTGTEPITTELGITGPAEELFYGGGVAEATPTIEPTAVVSPTAPITPTEPTAVPAPAGPLANIAISRGGIAYQSPYGPTQSVGNVAPGEVTTLVVKLAVGAETWYLIPVPSTGQSGWINSSLIDLPAADVQRIPEVSGVSPMAVVYSGGNVRTAPGGNVLTQVDAGNNVRVLARSADGFWYQIETPAGPGWVAGSLLTIDPAVVAALPVSP